ncbi:hypothetical protein [Phocaeicola plebeius]|jgi:hypothetical protein|uniref:hypothetical protein n=1 Tax=Phocaeicola plebeius TaxID=310297 RepID=UPI001DB81266|nr:hypothetical protein [Bacteroidales bacterium SW299]
MDNNSKYNLYRFIEKLQYHGDIQKINNTTGIYEKVALKDVDLKLPCGAYISSMILLIDTDNNIISILCSGIKLSLLREEVWSSNIFMGLPVRISVTDFSSLYQRIIFATLI